MRGHFSGNSCSSVVSGELRRSPLSDARRRAHNTKRAVTVVTAEAREISHSW